MPQITNANVYISEIMYDLEGTDTDREWIEIHNNSDVDIDLSSYFLYENNTAHKITGGEIIKAGDYAVIVDDLDKFYSDWPSFKGYVFDSAFSLSNAGEELILLNQQKTDIDTVFYEPSMGALGTGNSLQYLNGFFVPGLPTPGLENVTEPENEIEELETDNDFSNETESESVHSGQNDLSDFKPQIKVKTGIGRNRIVTINTPVEFNVYKSGDERGKYFWNFGDNKSDNSSRVEHVYKKEGVYNLVLNSVFKNYKNTSRSQIIVVKPNLKIFMENDLIGIKNEGENEVNIGGYVLEINNTKNKIIKDTILSKGQAIYFEGTNKDKVVLKYPNEEIYYSSSIQKAKDFCLKPLKAGLLCNVEKVSEFFDKI